MVASKLAEQTRTKGERMNNLDLSKGPAEIRPRDKFGIHEDNKFENLNFNMLYLDSKIGDKVSKSLFRNAIYNTRAIYQKNNNHNIGNLAGNKYSGNNHSNKDVNGNIINNNNENNNADNVVDKRFKTLPATETLPRDEVCHHGTGTLFGQSLLVCLCSSTTTLLINCMVFLRQHVLGVQILIQLLGKKKSVKVTICVRKVYKALEEDAFRPVLHHYDGPKFRLEFSVPETLDLLDLCEQAGSA
ncbi:hypothetical protein V6N13_034308 [Hibiscus sabdariffa]|uniref:DCD domain-containing protein n=1 Tax=Hibiscus sabdariffa TaxID=183260 RepID=A0ABR2F7W1_9ROSI